MESLADIEVLILKCQSEKSKTYISEAIKCYRAGAYRAAIVATWIALVFDLIDKIRELAMSGDGTAKTIADKYEKYIKEIEKGNKQGITKALEFEREILAVCKNELEFFDYQQNIDLLRLKEDRHRCAHPSFQQVGIPFEPSAEQARLHIRNTICHVLSQPPVQGKLAITNIKSQISSEFFPADEGKVMLELNKLGLQRPRDSLINNLIDALIFSSLDSNDILYKNNSVITTLNVIYDSYPALSEVRLRIQLNKILHSIKPEIITWAIFLIIKIRCSWSVLDQPSKDKIQRYIEIGAIDDVLPGLEVFINIHELENTVKTRINTLSKDELSTIISSENIHEYAKSRAIDLLSNSCSWDETNSVFIDLIFPLFNVFNEADIEAIIKLPTETNADILGANTYKLFVDRVRESQMINTEELNNLLLANNANYLIPQI